MEREVVLEFKYWLLRVRLKLSDDLALAMSFTIAETDSLLLEKTPVATGIVEKFGDFGSLSSLYLLVELSLLFFFFKLSIRLIKFEIALLLSLVTSQVASYPSDLGVKTCVLILLQILGI